MKLGLSAATLQDEQNEANHAGVIRLFDDYELLGELARGGMGVVYRARQKSLNREVAVKLILGGQLATPETVHRFQIEAEAAARLDHPGIVPIYEIGEFESQHYFSMKLIKGPNLQESLARFCVQPEMNSRQLSERHRKIAELTWKVADAVSFAHEHGVLHRDLKPSNILLEPNDAPLVTDFGLAKIADANQREITLTSTVMGSPAYMSPEQALGDSYQVTTATDVYGIGAILYGLLTGQAPFVGETALDVIRSVAGAEPVPPRKLNSAIDRDLETIALKCLEKQPDRRYTNVAEVGSEIKRFLAGRPIVARPISSVERFSRFCRRNAVVSGLVSLVLLSVLVGVVGIASQWRAAVGESRRADRYARNALQQRDNARWETYRSRIALAANAIEQHQIAVAQEALKAAPENYRNWEWDYFSSRLDVPLRIYETLYQGTPKKLWFNDDGSKLCCILSSEFLGGPHQTTVWNTKTGRVALAESSDSLLSADFSKLAVRTTDGNVAIHDMQTQRVFTIAHPKPALKHLVGFSPSGDFATRSEDGLHVWRGKSGEEKFQLLGQPNAFYGARFWELNNKQFLYQGGKRIRGYDTASGESNWALDFAGEEVHTVATSSTAKLLATSREYPNNSAELWDAESGTLRATLKGHLNVVFRMKFGPAGQLLASGSPDKTVRLWDTKTGNQLLLLSGHQNDILDLAFNRTGNILASSSLDDTVRIWDVETGQQIGTISTNAHKLAFHPNEPILTTADSTGMVSQWDLEKIARKQWVGHGGFVYGLAIHPDEKTIASTGWDKSVRIWNTSSGLTEEVIELQQNGLGTRFSKGGEYLAVTTQTELMIFLTEDWKQVWSTDILTYDIGTQAGVRPDLDPNGNLIACGHDRIPVIYGVRSGDVHSILRSHDGTVTDCSFVRDGRALITVGGTLICLHDVAKGTALASCRIPGAILSLGLNRLRTKFCVSSSQNVVHLFETSNPVEPVARLQHSSAPYSMVFSSDDSRLFVGCHDGTIRIWDLTKCEPVATLRGHADYVHALDIDRLDTLFSCSGDFSLFKWERKKPQTDNDRQSDPSTRLQRQTFGDGNQSPPGSVDNKTLGRSTNPKSN